MCISSDDFYDKVHPYERIISHQIYDVFLIYHLKGILPKTLSMGPRIVSTIIKPRIVSIIANWIDRNDSNIFSFNNKYKFFNLIYKKSRDGSDCMTFHNKCNGIGPFVVLIKVQSKMIYGGYNPIGYNGSNQWLISSESFILSFKNDQDVYMKIGRVINESYAIYDNNYCFFNFGGHLYTNG